MTGRLTFIVIAAIANFGLGLFVYLKNPPKAINRHFAFFSFAVAAWTLSNGLVSSYAGSESGYVWARFAFASASLIPLTFLWFADVFPTSQPYASTRILKSFSIVAAVSFVVSFTPLIVRNTSSLGGALQVLYGPLHLPFAIYLICCFGTSLFILIRKLRSLVGLEKLQVRYLFAAVLIAAFGATVTNLLIPLVLDTSRFSPYGPLFGMLMIAIIAHAIIRHRLLDIQLAIRNGVVYVGAIVVTASTFFVLAEALHHVTGFQRTTIPILEALVLAIAVAVLVLMGPPFTSITSIKWPQDFPDLLFPTAIVHAHSDLILRSRVLTTDQWGDYLIYINPAQKVFIDGRSDFYGPEVGNDYLHLSNGSWDWQRLSDKYHFNLALLPTELPLSQILKLAPEWRVVEDDGKRILLVRSSS